MHPSKPRSRRDAAGFAMLEALVGGLIFAIGVLGVVGLQSSMTQTQTIGKFRGDATYLANELIGLMWVDSQPNRASYSSALCSGYTRCSDWAAKVGRQLPGSTTAVAVNGATGVVTISITWTTRSGVQTYTTSSAINT